jgi:hypothetical protein
VIEEVRRVEATDLRGERWPRYKASDDATAGLRQVKIHSVSHRKCLRTSLAFSAGVNLPRGDGATIFAHSVPSLPGCARPTGYYRSPSARGRHAGSSTMGQAVRRLEAATEENPALHQFTTSTTTDHHGHPRTWTQGSSTSTDELPGGVLLATRVQMASSHVPSAVQHPRCGAGRKTPLRR